MTMGILGPAKPVAGVTWTAMCSLPGDLGSLWAEASRLSRPRGTDCCPAALLHLLPGDSHSPERSSRLLPSSGLFAAHWPGSRPAPSGPRSRSEALDYFWCPTALGVSATGTDLLGALESTVDNV